MNSSMSSNSTTIPHGVNVIRRHKKKMLFVFCSIVAMVLVGALMMQKDYRSEAKLLLRIGRETATLDPTATLGEVVNISRTDQSEVNSVLEILKSRDLIEEVVKEIGPEVILATNDSGPQAFSVWVSDLIASAKQGVTELVGDPASSANVDPEVAIRCAAIDELLDSITISAPLDSTVLSMAAEVSSPELAQQIVRTWKEMFLVSHLRLTSTEGSHKFLVEQQELIRNELQSAQDALRKEKDKGELATIEGERALLESLKAEVSLGEYRNAREVSSSEARCVDARRVLKDLPRTILATRTDGIADEAQDGMRGQLYQLEILEREMHAKYEVSHPLYKAAQNQLQGVRRILDQQAETIHHETFTTNPARETLHLELLQEEVRLASLRADARSLVEQHSEIAQAIKALNVHDVRIRDMERQTELLDESYRSYSKRTEQARINDAMARQRITSINVMQSPSYQPEPVSRSRLSILLAGIAGAVVAAFGVALFAESLNSSLRSPREVEEALELPVLITIPKSSKSSRRLA